MNSVLVTGGCGYIGSHTIHILLEAGYELIVLDSNINSSVAPLKRLQFLNYSKEIDFESKLKFKAATLGYTIALLII